MRTFFLASLLMSAAIETSSARENQTKRQRNLKTYGVNTKYCSFELTAGAGGDVVVEGTSDKGFSLFATRTNAKGAGLLFDFKCTAENAHVYCPNVWLETQDKYTPDPTNIMKTRQYDGFHPIYYSLAYAGNILGTPEPRARYVSFCMGSETHVIEGSSSVGSEQYDKTREALKIIKTIRIIQ